MQCYFPWTPELSVGLDEIDAQHRVLVDIINRIYLALINRWNREQVAQVLDELVQYTQVHFAVEESLFRITNYPDYESHKALHERLRDQVASIQRRFERGDIELDLKLMTFLRNWLTDHIHGEDKAYVNHLLASGLKPGWARPTWVGKIWHSLRA